MSSDRAVSGKKEVEIQHLTTPPVVLCVEPENLEFLSKWIAAAQLRTVWATTACELHALRSAGAQVLVAEPSRLRREQSSSNSGGSVPEFSHTVTVRFAAPETEPHFFLPQHLGRMLVHLRALHRSELTDVDGPLVSGGLVIDPRSRQVCSAYGEKTLTAIQFEILRALAERAGQVLSFSELRHKLSELQTMSHDRGVLRYHVTRLRSRLGKCGQNIENVRGLGYRLCAAH